VVHGRSVVHPHSQECIAAACAIAICDRSGALVGLAEARLPSRVTTAAEAEAWGIFFAVFVCPFPPHIVTDCLSLLRTAECGTASATAATRRLGGIWARIAASLDGNLASLVEGERLVWMPAHQTSADTARRVKSNGQPVSYVDWRANRLADVVARSAAIRGAPRQAVIRCVRDATDALRLEAAALGAVTRAANNHSVNVVTADGTTVTTTRRDSFTPQAASNRQRRSGVSVPTLPAPAPVRVGALPLAGTGYRASVVPSTEAARRATAAASRKRQRSADARVAAHDDYVIRRILAERGSTTAPAAGAQSGDRFEALRRRIATKETEAAVRGVSAMPPAPSWLGAASAALEASSDLGS
jgi:hypothetical protein